MTLADELQKIQALRDGGTLSEEEFQQAKARLLDEEPAPRDVERDSRQWAFFLHLSQYAHFLIPFGGVVLPIVFWQIKKDEYPGIDAHGKAVLNWVLSAFLYLVVAVPLCFILIGIPLVVVILLAGLVFPLIGAIKAQQGEVWNYPGAIPFLR